MNLLIVDDEIEIINGIMAGIHWENLGLQSVYKATSIEESMKLFEQEQIDVVWNGFGHVIRKRSAS